MTDTTDKRRQAAMFELFNDALAAGHIAAPDRTGPANFPWYDSHWLNNFVDAARHLSATDPQMLAEFLDATSIFRIAPDTPAPWLVDDFFDADTLDAIRAEVAAQRPADLERHELAAFGRDVVHDNPLFLELQTHVVDVVSDVVGEALDVSYNFLSLYRGPDARCDLHLDAPDAKWTLDVCIDQSQRWPIHISPIVPWPEENVTGADWQEQIKHSMRFEPYEMEPGQALIFGGSSQWHYREPMVDAVADDFCTLLFFHFTPAGAADALDYRSWPARFGVPTPRHSV